MRLWGLQIKFKFGVIWCLIIWGLDSQVGSVVGQSAKGPGSIPGGAEVLGTDGICKYLPVSVLSYVEVCLCLLCSVCIN